MRTVEVVGSGPAVQALTAALEDVELGLTQNAEPALQDVDLLVVVDTVGAEAFSRGSDRARETTTPWVAVELGGIGGVPVTDAAISAYGPETGCFDCLSGRVAATVDDSASLASAPSASTQRFAGALAGRLIAQYLDGDGALFGTVVELQHIQHRFLPLPGCHCADPPATRLDAGRTTAPESEALTRAEIGLDDRVGLVQEVGEIESFPAPYYLSTLADTTGFSDAQAAQQAAGVSADWDTAFMKALGEGYERYAAGVYRADDLVSGTADEVLDAVDPASFVRDESEWDEETVLHWIPAQNLVTNDECHLPAETVLYPPPSTEIRPVTTTGLGLGNTVTEAVLTGLYEVIERDATMLSWYSTFEPLEVTIDSAQQYDTLRRRAAAEGLDVTALLLTQDVDVPVITVALEGDTWPKLALGTSAALVTESAAVGALEEAIQNWMELDSMGPEDARDADGAIGRYAAEPGPAASLTDVETAVSLDSLGLDEGRQAEAGNDGDEPLDTERELEILTERVDDAGLVPYATRLTTRDIEQMGFEGVRVVCPTAQPLFFGESYFGERAERVPADLGFEPRQDHDHHPFP